MAATAMKAYDVIINLLIPTPLYDEKKDDIIATTTANAGTTTTVVQNNNQLEEGVSTDSNIDEEINNEDYKPVVVYERKCLGTTEWKQCSVVVRDELDGDIPLTLLPVTLLPVSTQNTEPISPTTVVPHHTAVSVNSDISTDFSNDEV